MVKRAAVLLLLVVVCSGCASSSDIKPGTVRGVDDRGYVKTTEGFGLAMRGCSDEEIWRGMLDTVTTLRATSWVTGKQLAVLKADQASGRIDASDEGTSFVGVFLHRLDADLRLVEVSAFWKTRMTVTENPWEPAVLKRLSTRLTRCVVPPATVPAIRLHRPA